MVHELSPGHKHHRHGVVVEPEILVDGAGDYSRVGQGETSSRHSWSRNTISIVWGEEPVVDVPGSSPVWIVQVVAGAVHSPVSAIIA